uniref:Uncharacterized protein n=1 Tax=Panagrolaimus sp. ES5 TaxID=591445 RepID=A0AC34FK67_9BILA
MTVCVLHHSVAQKFPSVFQNSDLGLMYRFQNENMKRTVEIKNPAEMPIIPPVPLEEDNGLGGDVSTMRIMPKPLSYLLFFKSLRSTATRFPRSEKQDIPQTENVVPFMPNLQNYRYFMKQQPLFG